MEIASPPHAPQVRIFKSGNKDAKTSPDYVGEILYNSNEMEPHVALRLAEMVARNAMNDRLPESGIGIYGEKGDYESGKTGDELKDEDLNDLDDQNEYWHEKPETMWNGPGIDTKSTGKPWIQDTGKVHQNRIRDTL